MATITDSTAGNPLIQGRSAPVNLLPPIPLYRRLLRAHRTKLPAEERLMGDMYIKSEFRAHRKVDNPMHIIGFLTEWQMYAQQVEGDSWRGDKLDKERIDKMSGACHHLDVETLAEHADGSADQQIGQLYELMQAIEKQSHDDDGESEGSGRS